MLLHPLSNASTALLLLVPGMCRFALALGNFQIIASVLPVPPPLTPRTPYEPLVGRKRDFAKFPIPVQGVITFVELL